MSRMIDADALIKYCDDNWIPLNVDAVNAQPTIEERKVGKWIVYKAPDKYHCGLCKCPFCGEEMIAESDEYNFCPNCGADMRESHCDDCRFYDEECVYCPVKQERREK